VYACAGVSRANRAHDNDNGDDDDGDDGDDDDDDIHDYYYDAAWGLHEDPLVGFWPPTL